MARANIFISTLYRLGRVPNKQQIRVTNIEAPREGESLGI